MVKFTVNLPPVYLGLLDAVTELRGAPSRTALFREGDAFPPELASPAWLQEAVETASRGLPPWPGAVTKQVTLEVPTGSPFAPLKALPPLPRAEATARVDHDVSPAVAATRLGQVVIYGTQRIPRPVYDAIAEAEGVVITRLGMGRCNGPGLAEDGSWKRLAKRTRPMHSPGGNAGRRLPT